MKLSTRNDCSLHGKNTKSYLLGYGYFVSNCILYRDTNHMHPKYSRIKNFSSALLSIVLIKVLCPFATTNVCSGKDVFYFNPCLFLPILQVMLLHVWICMLQLPY